MHTDGHRSYQHPDRYHLVQHGCQPEPAHRTVVGTFSSTDPDAGDTFTYSLVPGLAQPIMLHSLLR